MDPRDLVEDRATNPPRHFLGNIAVTRPCCDDLSLIRLDVALDQPQERSLAVPSRPSRPRRSPV